MHRLSAIGVVVMAALGLLAGEALAQTKVLFRLDWKPGGQYSPFYLAKEKGFFAAEGLDVQIIPGSGSSDSIKQLGVRAVNIALLDGTVLVQALEQRVPAKAVGAYYQRSPIVMISPKTRPITEIKQLLGEVKIGAPKASAVYQGLIALLAANNMKLEQIKLVDIGFGVQPLLVKQVDAIMAYTNVQPIQAEGAGMAVHEVFLSDFGVNGYGTIIAASSEFLAKQPAAIAGFLRATKRAVQAAAGDRDGAVRAVAQAVPEVDTKHELKVLDRTLPLWTAKPGDFASFGMQEERRWQQTIEVAQRVGLVERPPAAKDVYTAELMK